jgi:predicted ATPase/class 3 adenylate cyclase
MDTVPLPTGTVSFLFTDIEGSTRKWDAHPEAMAAALAAHDQIFREVTAKNNGAVFKTVGDAFCCAFARPLDALNASIDAQRQLSAYGWPAETGEVRVRMGIHTGTAIERDGDYFGPTLNRVARLMSVAHGGQIVLSAATASLLQSSTPSGVSFIDLGLHRLKDLSQPEHTFQIAGDGLRAEFPPLHSLDVIANNLPTQLTSFIGRERELHDLKAMLAEHRLITLTGPGGIGKTRLSLQLAAESTADFKDGCWCVSLAGVEQADLVPSAVASAIGIHETPGQSVTDTIARDVGERHMLLVIDNAEHVLGEVAALARLLLLACAHVAIVVTSRESLHVAGEQVVRILPMPEADREHLFLERARAVRSEFQVKNEEVAAWTDLLQKLEGIPLAIELAAARLSTFTITQMDDRLSSRLVLASRDSTGSSRQRTLRSTIDWSYQLLSDDEKRAFAQLAIFEGTFTLEACDGVLSRAGLRSIEDLLQSLVEKSFVTSELDAKIPFYALLEMLREFGLEQLGTKDDKERAARNHCEYYVELAAAGAKKDLKDRVAWLDVIDVNLGNFRAALTWSLEHDPQKAASLAVDLSLYWQIRSVVTEARGWLEQTIDRSVNLAPAQLAPVLDRAAVFATMQDDYDEARVLCARARVLYQGLKDPIGLGKAIHALGVIEHRAGNVAAARDHYARSVESLERANAPRLLSTALANLAALQVADGDLTSAEESLGECLRLTEGLGDLNLMSSILLQLATLEMRRSRLDRAESLLQRALQAKRDLRNRSDIAEALAILSMVTARAQKPGAAREYARESLHIAADLESKALIVKVLEAFVLVAVSEGDYRGAARLLGLSERLRNEGGILMDRELEDIAPAIRAALGTDEFQEFTTQGSTMSLADELATLSG